MGNGRRFTHTVTGEDGETHVLKAIAAATLETGENAVILDMEGGYYNRKATIFFPDRDSYFKYILAYSSYSQKSVVSIKKAMKPLPKQDYDGVRFFAQVKHDQLTKFFVTFTGNRFPKEQRRIYMPPTRILDGFVSYFGCDEETEEGMDPFRYGQYRLEILTREWNEVSREHAMSLCPLLFTGDQLNKDDEDDLFDE